MFPAVADTTLLGGGVFALMASFAGLLFAQLRKNDDSYWKIVAAKDKEIERLAALVLAAEKDRDVWMNRYLEILGAGREETGT